MGSKKARDEMDIQDLLSPIDMLKLGTDDDPCFGTFNAKANECKICGDSAVCQVYQSQLSHTKREEVEAKQKFKDLEMEVKTHYLEEKEVKKIITKAAKRGDLSKGKAFRLVKKKLDPKDLVESAHIQKVILSAVRNSNKLQFIKQNNKRYIGWTQ